MIINIFLLKKPLKQFEYYSQCFFFKLKQNKYAYFHR